MTERTPGPWAAEPNTGGYEIPGSWRVNHAGTRQWVASQVSGEADARLIAAAPELLEALKRVRQAFYVDGKAKALRAAFEGTKELVAKAEGRQQ